MRWIALAWSVLGVAADAVASGNSYAVDDASVTPDGTCQVESWTRRFDDSAFELSGTPACTRGGIELGLTATRVAGAGDPSTQLAPGAKWVAGDLASERWTVGFAVAATFDDAAPDEAVGYAMLSAALDDAHRVLVHSNLGVRARGGAVDLLRGLGVDVVVWPELGLLAEMLRVGDDRLWQAGLRWNASAAISVDLIRGEQRDPALARWWTLGINVAF